MDWQEKEPLDACLKRAVYTINSLSSAVAGILVWNFAITIWLIMLLCR